MPFHTIDILRPELYEKGVPHDLYERLRRESPVFWHDEPQGPGFWAITKHRDVVEVSRDAATFSSERGGTQIQDLPKSDARASPDLLANMDPPRHTRFRAIIGQSFTPTAVARLEDYVQRVATTRVNEAIERVRFDFMADFAAKLPTATIFRMVGVPSEDAAMLDDWVMKFLAVEELDPEVSGEERAQASQKFMDYAHSLAAARRKAPRDDLLSGLMAAEVDGQRLSYQEFGMFFMLLLAAGTHSTRITLGNGMLLLMQHPVDRARLVDDPTLASSAVEEVLRYCPPILHFRRTAVRDTVIRDQKISAGQKVVLWYASANRDDEVFANANTFDIGRTPNDHVSFGYGPHFCIGNSLARLSLRIILRECVRRMPGLELDGPTQRLRSNWFNGVKQMPVVVRHVR
jgi:cholest-4-en-3-one 26-monooxygenase